MSTSRNTRSALLATTLLIIGFAGWPRAAASANPDSIAYQPQPFVGTSSSTALDLSSTGGLVDSAGILSVPALASALNLSVHWMAPVPPPSSSSAAAPASTSSTALGTPPPPVAGDSTKAMYAAPASQSLEWLSRSWSLWNSRLYGGDAENLSFMSDPFSSNSSSSSLPDQVLKIEYPKGTFKQSGDHGSGGATFYPSPPELGLAKRALLSYQVAFDEGFQYVKGGKLPGFWSGKAASDCSGGKKSDGSCFSLRMMWRADGAGEGGSTELVHAAC